jgi:tetratricopeptide (TPR) repeat protein
MRLGAMAVVLCSVCGAGAWGQGSSEVTPRVEALYVEAKAAQQAGDETTAVAKYEAILKAAPHLAPAYNNLGALYFDRGEYAAAARTLERGLALDPRMTTASGVLGMSYLKLGRNVEAKARLQAAVTAHPSDNTLQMSLARALLNLGEYEEAARQLRVCVERNPKDQAALYLLGKTYLQLSERTLSKIPAIDPNSVTAHEVTGEIDESMRNYDGALAEYSKAVQLAPNQPGTHYRLGTAFWLEQKWESARVEFEAELRNDPGNCTTEWKLGNTLLAAEHPASEALPPLDAAIARCPDLMQARVDRANVLLKLNQPQKAIDDLLLAAAETPREPSIHFLLWKAYKAAAKPEKAAMEIATFGRLQREASEATAALAGDVVKIKNAAR